VLSARKDFTLDGLRAAAFDSYQTWFEKPIPALVKAWDATPDSNPLKAKTKDQIALLRNWDCRWGAESVQTSLAIFWADDIQRKVSGEARQSGQFVWDYLGSGKVAPDVMLQSLANASDKLTADFGKWNTPWGDINRFQRITDDIAPKFTDDGPSIPVEFSSATWGSLASFGARAYPGTKKWYGTSGNSFVAVIEFGPKVTAMAVTAGGESGDPKSPHFDDEAQRYATGNLRPVYFYKDDVLKHVEKQYTPGK
jgi:acyl-homoserine-lactone acylase